MRRLRASFATPVALLVVLTVTGCTSTRTPSTYYLLRGEIDERTTTLEEPPRVGLGNVVVASYLLDSEGIVIETRSGELQPATTHLWAETLDQGLRWYLRGEISRALGTPIGVGIMNRAPWEYTVDVVFSQLHATMAGTAVIDARVAIIPRDAQRPVRVTEFARTIPLPREGYAGVIEAEKALLTQLSTVVADEVRALVAP